MASEAELRARAEQFADRYGGEVDFARRLGFGQDGQIWRCNNENAPTAIKVFERKSNFTAELSCYQRLQSREMEDICGLQVPALVRSDDELLVVEMSIVKPPYLLDFGKAHLDRPFDFSPEGHAEWREQMAEMWGEDLPLVDRVLARLRSMGIYYYDAKPGNMVLFGKKSSAGQ